MTIAVIMRYPGFLHVLFFWWVLAFSTPKARCHAQHSHEKFSRTFVFFDWFFLGGERSRRYENSQQNYGAAIKNSQGTFRTGTYIWGAKSHFFGSAHTPEKGVFPLTGMKKPPLFSHKIVGIFQQNTSWFGRKKVVFFRFFFSGRFSSPKQAVYMGRKRIFRSIA